MKTGAFCMKPVKAAVYSLKKALTRVINKCQWGRRPEGW